MSLTLATKKRIAEDWRQLSITSADLARFNKIVKYLGDVRATSTYMVAQHLHESCDVVRRDLKRMEKRGYVVADCNGSNKINWRLAA